MMLAVLSSVVLAGSGQVTPTREVDSARVERVLAGLSTRARAAQLVLAYPQLGRDAPVEVGGLLFVGTLLRNPAEAKERIARSRKAARIPPLVAVDMEGGPSNRMKAVKAVKDLPAARDLARLPDAEVEAWGFTVGTEMARLGFNVNLAPVLDVAAAGHMERTRRSFSGDEAVVLAKARAYARGLLRAGVMPIGKHFPGYGDTDGDSDHALVTVDWPKEKVLAHARTFEKARDVLGGVMMANVAYAAVDARPAILSPKLVELAHRQGFLTMTDDVAIDALADAVGGTSRDVLEAAFTAGNDIILITTPPDWDKGLDAIGILTALAESSPEHRQRLEAACRRVLELKDRLGLLEGVR